MRYNIIGKNIDVWDKTKEMVEKKMDRIAKLFPADTCTGRGAGCGHDSRYG